MKFIKLLMSKWYLKLITLISILGLLFIVLELDTYFIGVIGLFLFALFFSISYDPKKNKWYSD